MENNSLSVYIPILPPGINATYKVSPFSGKKIYKNATAVKWAEGAAHLIRNASSLQEWTDNCETYDLYMEIWGWRGDVDSHIKLVQDTVCQSLGFDDKRIRSVCSRKMDGAQSQPGISIKLNGYGLTRTDPE